MRTLRLVEYRPREVRLQASTVAALAACAAFEVVPTWRRGIYRVTALGQVGVLHTADVRVVVRPKLPWANVAHLLAVDAPRADHTTPERAGNACDWLARLLAAQLREHAASGLPRSYVEVAEQERFLQGRLDVAAQMRDGPTAKDRFHVQRTDFTTASPLHRFVKHVALALLPSPLLLPGTVAALRDALEPYAEITPDAHAHAHAPEAPTLLTVAQWLHTGLQPGLQHGPHASPAFFVNMAHVFERYVLRGLHAHLPDVQAQRSFCYHAPVAAQPLLVGRPDATVGTRAVVDVKWKTLTDTPPAADVQQVLAYALGLGVRDVRLIYPGKRSRCWTYTLPNDVTLRIHTLRVVGTPRRCQAALERLARSL